NDIFNCPVAASHRRNAPAVFPAASILPSLEKPTAEAPTVASSYGCKVIRGLPLVASQRVTDPNWSPVRRVLPSGENAAEWMFLSHASRSREVARSQSRTDWGPQSQVTRR